MLNFTRKIGFVRENKVKKKKKLERLKTVTEMETAFNILPQI